MSEIVAVFKAIGRGLQHVHDQGLVHQDFKPGNVLIDAADQPHVVDFGIAAAIASGPATPGGPSELAKVRGAVHLLGDEERPGLVADPEHDGLDSRVWFAADGPAVPQQHPDVLKPNERGARTPPPPRPDR